MKCTLTLQKRLWAGITSVVLFCFGAPYAIGTPITVVFSGPATGTLGATPFTGAQLTATGIGDTADITLPLPNVPCINLKSVSINIAGIGSAAATGPNLVFDNQTVSVWGLTNGICAAPAGDWLDEGNPQAATYGLTTSIGPTTGTAGLVGSVNTTAGVLHLTAGPATFQATLGQTQAAPIPTLSPWTLLLLGLVLTAVAAFFLRGWTLTNR